jgi:hypothetical protein
MMRFVARQFAAPHGPLGWLIGRGMARSNGDINWWTVGEVERHLRHL